MNDMTDLELIRIAKMKIFNYVIGDILKTIKGGALMGAFVQSFCLIDYLSAIARLANNDAIGDNYEKFVESYLPDYDQKKLYAIRCGLVHTYGQSRRMEEADLKGYKFQHKNPENHRKYEDKIYWLNLSNFVFDVIKVTHLFFLEIEQKVEAGADLPEIERANNIISVWGPLGMIVSPNFGMIDPILSCLDSTSITWAILENEIYKLCLEK